MSVLLLLPPLPSNSTCNPVVIQKTASREPRSDRFEPQKSFSFQNVVSDSASAVHALTSCTASRNLKLGLCVHAAILKSGLRTNIFVNNALLDMYTKCGCMGDATKLFDYIPERNVVSWTSMITGYCQKGFADEAISVFCQMLENVYPNEFTLAALLQVCAQKYDPRLVHVVHGYVVKSGFLWDDFLQNSLIGAYAKSGILGNALKLLQRFSCRDVVSWTSVISGFVLHGMMIEALLLFFRMQQDGVIPNEVTILSILRASSTISEWQIFQLIHGFVLKLGWCKNELVLNSVVEMYLVNGYFKEGIQVFSKVCFASEGLYLSPETMATLLQGCAHSNYLNLGKQIHSYLVKHRFFPCTVVENSLIDMYAETEQNDSASQIFARMSNRDIISWNTMATCLVKNGQFYEAFKLLKDIHCGRGEMIRPDFVTMLASIQACSNLASLQLGQVIHGYITRAGLISDIYIRNGLIDMYGRLGSLDLAEKIFEEMPIRDLGSWNSLIAAYGTNGDAISALKVFTELKKSRVHRPNAITFTNTLAACSHAGLVDEGFDIFNCMVNEYKMEPSMEHFACVVDLLGRSGRLEEAEAFIEKIPVTPGKDVWSALLGACGYFGDVDIAERAAGKLAVWEPEGKVWRVALSNVYASKGKWEKAARIRAEMRRTEGMKKEGGWSSVEVGGDVFSFMVNDTRHPESRLIYAVLFGMKEHIRDAGV